MVGCFMHFIMFIFLITITICIPQSTYASCSGGSSDCMGKTCCCYYNSFGDIFICSTYKYIQLLFVANCESTGIEGFPASPIGQFGENIMLVNFGYTCDIQIYFNNVTITLPRLRTFSWDSDSSCLCLEIPPDLQGVYTILNRCTTS